jgi:hypothetical protein
MSWSIVRNPVDCRIGYTQFSCLQVGHFDYKNPSQTGSNPGEQAFDRGEQFATMAVITPLIYQLAYYRSWEDRGLG